MKIVAIIQARMGSERLPGKSLKKICGRPILEHIINRISASKKINNIIVATTDRKIDLPIVSLSKKLSIPYYTGSEDDVLDRFIGAGESVLADIVVRLCGDNPLIDIRYLDDMIDSHRDKKAEYTYNCSPIPIGTAGEVVNFGTLKKINLIAKDKRYREHVTTYILDHLNEFNINCTNPPLYLKDKTFRLTVDTEEDLKLMRSIYKRLYQEGKIIETSQAISLLESNSNLSKINIHIPQKNWRA
jgi:spore coat polysaccharide biosynthesis protein SpsF